MAQQLTMNLLGSHVDLWGVKADFVCHFLIWVFLILILQYETGHIYGAVFAEFEATKMPRLLKNGITKKSSNKMVL